VLKKNLNAMHFLVIHFFLHVSHKAVGSSMTVVVIITVTIDCFTKVLNAEKLKFSNKTVVEGFLPNKQEIMY